MTILFMSEKGKSLGLTMRCASEGFSISLYIEEEAASFIGNGLVDKPSFSKHLLNQNSECIASNVNQLMDEVKPDLVILDAGMGKVADYLQERGQLVFGSSHFTDTLLDNDSYAEGVMKRVGIRRDQTSEGILVECGFWWNGLQPLFPFLVWNEDRFMTDSLGPRVESASNIISSIHSHPSHIILDVLKMERLLKKSKFHGILSLSCIVSKSKVYGVSFTPSTLYLPSLLELYKGSVTDLLLAVASGRKGDGEFTTDYALSLLLSIPPYPSPITEYSKTAIKGVSPSNLKHIYLMDVEKNGSGYESAGLDGALMMVSARGRDVGECKKRVMKTIANLGIEDVQYRTDSTKRISIEEERLREWGYLI